MLDRLSSSDTRDKLHCPSPVLHWYLAAPETKSEDENVVATAVSVVEKKPGNGCVCTQNESDLNFSFLYLLKMPLPTKLTKRTFRIRDRANAGR